MKIESIMKTDIKIIEKLEVENYPNPYTLKMLEDIVSNKSFICNKLVQNKTIIGYFFILLTIDKLEIIKITISKAYQGSGYGDFLLTNIITLAKNNQCDEILLEVNESNIKAVKLYQKYEFKCLKKIEGYYGNYGHGFLMSKRM